jgi:hypothetical protein
MGKNPPSNYNACKKKMRRNKKVVAKQPCPSLQEDLAIVQVYAH